MSIIANTTNQAVLNKSSKDKFMLVFNPPVAYKNWHTAFNINNNLIAPDSVQFSIYGVVVPEVSVPALVLAHGGQSIQVSSHARPGYSECTVNFAIDNRFKNWWTIWKWLDLLNNARESVYDANELGDHQQDYIRNYTVDMSVFALDEYNKRIMEFVYKMAFPTRIGEILYNHQDEEQIISEFSFAYSQLLVKPILITI